MELKIQTLLREHFSGVVVRRNLHVPNDGDVPIFDVFLVPDDRRGEFIRFAIKRFGTLATAAGLPEVSLISHCVSATREHYPEIVLDESTHRGEASTQFVPTSNALNEKGTTTTATSNPHRG